jgi:acetyl-CoA carboxylase carboxyl transferase subunit alpha
MDYIPLEKPIAELEIQIHEFRQMAAALCVNLDKEIKDLEDRAGVLRKKIFTSLTPYETVQLSRHPRRPNTLEMVGMICDEWTELHGDRNYYDDSAIVGGLGRLAGTEITFVWIGHQKGRGTKENIERNFGMPKPEGYRKALRLMSLGERFSLPIITFIDTPGAYPGIGAEQRGQSEAIGKNIMVMSKLKVPILTFVIGEGGSGGALAIGVANRVYMLSYATYSVISPEGCASILMKDAGKASQIAETLGLTAQRALSLGVIDGILTEPLGGIHRDPKETALKIHKTILKDLKELSQLSPQDLRRKRADKFMNMGSFVEPSKNKKFIVAVDGPAGAGKSSICKEVSRRLGFWYVNTGAIYRALAWLALSKKVSGTNEKEMAVLARDLREHLSWDPKSDQVFYRGQGISVFLDRSEIGALASAVAKLPGVREELLPLQRRLAHDSNTPVLVDGRDMGTVVFPEARVKIFLTASLEKRAERRWSQLQKDRDSLTLEHVTREMAKRDEQDSSRALAPLKAAQDATLLDTTHLSFEESVASLIALVTAPAQ